MKKKMSWLIVTTIVLCWIDPSTATAWGVGWLAVLLRRALRYRYVSQIQMEQTFNISKYLLYTGFSFFIALSVVGLALYYKRYMNPYLILLVYVIDYIFILIEQYKGESI